MAFVIIDNKEISDPQVQWKFETLERVFLSDPNRFDRNVDFWRKKLMVSPDVRVQILNGADVEDAHYEVVEQKSVENESITDTTAIEPTDSQSDEQSSLSHDTESAIDTPKRKPRKKTA